MHTPQDCTVLKGHQAAVYALGAANGFLWSAGGDGQLLKWDTGLPNEKPLQFAAVPAAAYSLLCLPSDQLALGIRSGGLYVFDTEGKKLLHRHQMPDDVFGLAHDSRHLYTGTAEGTIAAIGLENPQTAWTAKMATERARCIEVLHAQDAVAVGYSDGCVRILAPDSGKARHEWRAHNPSVFALAATADGKWLLTGGRDAHLRLWRADDDFSLAHEVAAHWFTVNSIACNPANGLFATASRDKTVRLWAVENGKISPKGTCTAPDGSAHTHSVNKVVWVGTEAGETALASASDDSTIRLWHFS